MRKGEAGDTGRGYGKAGVAGGAAPAGLQDTPCDWGWRGKASCRRKGQGLRGGRFALGQESGRRGGEVVVPLKPTTCTEPKTVSGLLKMAASSCRRCLAITFFICGAFGVGEAVQVAGRGSCAAELWCLTTGAIRVVSQFLGGGLLHQKKLTF